jgi:hypothetical protein
MRYVGVSRNALVLSLLVTSLTAGCSDDAESTERPGSQPPSEGSWEYFRSLAERNSRIVDGRRVYIVEWDIPMSESQLYDYYTRHYVDTPKSTVDLLTNGADNIWQNSRQLELTYCVSNSFGSNFSRMQTEMEQATQAWSDVVHVRFIYKPSEDGNCVDANTNIEFPVVPFASGGACAFLPDPEGSPPCTSAGRALVIDIADIDNWRNTGTPNLMTLGVLRHELGHILGLRHEHIREANNANDPSCPTGAVSEIQNPGPNRALTGYDVNSTMHYPWCDGNDLTSSEVTDLDGEGTRSLYGQPIAWYVAEFY